LLGKDGALGYISPMKRRSRRVPTSLTHNLIDLVNEERAEASSRSLHERVAEKMTNFASTGIFFGFHIVWFALWILWNTGTLGGKPFDPYPFEFLTLVVSLEAIILSLFVLIAQNRLQESSDRRAELDLHINLLGERESTMILRKLCRLEGHFKIEADRDEREMVNELLEDTNPVEVYKTIQSIYKSDVED